MEAGNIAVPQGRSSVSVPTWIIVMATTILISVTLSAITTATVLHDSLRGPQGEVGAVGPQGKEGERGKRGRSGKTGAAGANGVDGATIVREEACSNDIDVPLPYC